MSRRLGTTLRVTERCQVLNEIGQGLLNRVWTLKHNLATNTKYPSLTCDEFAKIRKKLEASFPEQPDCSKIPGFAPFRDRADDVIKENVEAFVLLMESLDFKNAALDALFSIFGVRRLYNLTLHPQVVQAALDLMVCFIKIHLLWCRIEGRKTMVSLLLLAYHLKGDVRHDPPYARVSAYIQEFSAGVKWLRQQFSPFSSSVGDILGELSETVMLSMDPATMRQMNVFNPLEEGAAMALPSRRPSSAKRPKLWLHPELAKAPSYSEYVAWGCLACPAELFRDDVLNLFKAVATDHLVFTLFRDEVVEFPPIIEDLFNWFPPKGFVAPVNTVPKDLKHKKVLKDLFKDFFPSCRLRHRERASYFKGELANLVNLFTKLPGLLGPKFTMGLALASMTQAEVLWISRHNRYQSGLTAKAKPKKGILEKDLIVPPSQVAEMIGLLDQMGALIREHVHIIRQYHLEYLQGAHKAAYEQALTEALSSTSVEGEPLAIVNGVPKHLKSTSIPTSWEIQPSLKAIRVAWTRFLTYLVTNTDASSQPANGMERLIHLGNELVASTCFVDSLKPLLERHFYLHQTWWHRQYLSSMFNDLLQSPDGDGIEHSLSVVRILGAVTNNVHPANAPEEMTLRDESAALATQFVESLVAKVDNTLQGMANNIMKLADQVSPVEAVKRLDRLRATKQPEPPPGYESTAGGFESNEAVKSLMRLQHTAGSILGEISRHPELQVAHRKFHLRRHIHSRLDAALGSFINSCYNKEMARPSVALRGILGYVQAIQKVAQFLPMDAMIFIRKQICQAGWISTSVAELQDNLLSPHRLSMVGRENTDQLLEDEGRIIGKISAWYVNFIDTVAKSASGGGDTPSILYIEERRTFLLHRSKNEMQALVSLVGPMGVDIIESDILTYVIERLRSIKTFLDTNGGPLSAFRDSVHTASPSIINVGELPGLDKFFQDTVKVGIALALRKLMYTALAEVQTSKSPALTHMMANVCNSVELDPLLAGSKTLKGFDRLARFTGAMGAAHDTKLYRCMDQVEADWHKWGLFPYALAASFHADSWRDTQYVIEHDGYTGNEHLTLKVLSELLLCLKAKSFDDPPSDKINVKELGRGFLVASSFVLLRLKTSQCQQPKGLKDRNMNVLFTVLEKFVDWFPDVDRGMLERYLPYALIHHAHMEISLTTNRPKDQDVIPLTGTKDQVKQLNLDEELGASS